METKRIKTQVVMLPTKIKVINSGIYKYSEISSGCEQSGWWNELRIANFENTMGDFSWNIKEAQELYFLSDDKIKEGDWYIWLDNNQICQADAMIITINNHIKNGHIKKIIATTNTSLKISKFSHYSEDFVKIAVYKDSLLPQPSIGFINKFIEEYNKGNIIEDILVEYEVDELETKFRNRQTFGNWEKYKNPILKLKVNPKDNTITIHPVKDSWNREEILKDIESAIIEGLDIGQYRDKWIK